MTRPGRPDRTVAAAAGTALVLFLALLVLVTTRWTPLLDLDRRVARDAHDLVAPHPALATVLRGISTVGQPVVFQTLAVVVAVLLLRARRVRSAALVTVVALTAGLWSRLVKALVDRRRPVVPDPVAHATGASFPSGHAIGSASAVLVLLLVLLPAADAARRRVLVTAGLVAVLAVGASRVLLSVHYVSDVLAGWLLAVTWTLLVLLAVRHLPLRRRVGAVSRTTPPR